MRHLRVVEENWEKSRSGYYFLVRGGDPRGMLRAKTKSAVTAANLLNFGFLGSSAYMLPKGMRVKDVPEY